MMLTPTPRYTETALGRAPMPSVTATGFSLHTGKAGLWDPYLRRWEGGRENADTVFGIVEVLSGPATDVAEVVWKAVDAAFTEQRMTITRLFNNALTAAHENLSDYAARGWQAGATLAAMRGNELYVAWAGPSLALFANEPGGVFKPSAADNASEESEVVLGADGTIAPRLVSVPVGSGVELLLSWASLSQKVTSTALGAILSGGSEGSTQAIYRLGNDEPEFAALVAKFLPRTD